jgi:hypothetical protein
MNYENYKYEQIIEFVVAVGNEMRKIIKQELFLICRMNGVNMHKNKKYFLSCQLLIFIEILIPSR